MELNAAFSKLKKIKKSHKNPKTKTIQDKFPMVLSKEKLVVVVFSSLHCWVSQLELSISRGRTVRPQAGNSAHISATKCDSKMLS